MCGSDCRNQHSDSTDRLGDTQCQCHRTGSEAQEEEEEHPRDISWPAVHSGVPFITSLFVHSFPSGVGQTMSISHLQL
ncbi:hypothetical protein O3P69_019098 [Scylla paramamosain]|uniref:Uncharacterized protein n=1 Tax=Scylla paramamosain TaxID=85552 RepID=A0AAW0SAB4_SCYPA